MMRARLTLEPQTPRASRRVSCPERYRLSYCSPEEVAAR